MSEKTGSRKRSIASLLQSAVDLKVHCEKDKELLVGAGLSWSYYDELLEWTDKTQKYYTQMILYREDCKCATAALVAFARECSDLRTTFRELVISALEKVSSRSMIAGMSQKKAYIDISFDLLELAVIAEKLISKDPHYIREKELIPKARDYSAQLFQMASGSKIPNPPDPQIKQKYLEAKKTLASVKKQIQSIGKNTFREDPVRRRAYLFEG
jgi:hypothetical protein